LVSHGDFGSQVDWHGLTTNFVSSNCLDQNSYRNSKEFGFLTIPAGYQAMFAVLLNSSSDVRFAFRSRGNKLVFDLLMSSQNNTISELEFDRHPFISMTNKTRFSVRLSRLPLLLSNLSVSTNHQIVDVVSVVLQGDYYEIVLETNLSCWRSNFSQTIIPIAQRCANEFIMTESCYGCVSEDSLWKAIDQVETVNEAIVAVDRITSHLSALSLSMDKTQIDLGKLFVRTAESKFELSLPNGVVTFPFPVRHDLELLVPKSNHVLLQWKIVNNFHSAVAFKFLVISPSMKFYIAKDIDIWNCKLLANVTKSPSLDSLFSLLELRDASSCISNELLRSPPMAVLKTDTLLLNPGEQSASPVLLVSCNDEAYLEFYIHNSFSGVELGFVAVHPTQTNIDVVVQQQLGRIEFVLKNSGHFPVTITDLTIDSASCISKGKTWFKQYGVDNNCCQMFPFELQVNEALSIFAESLGSCFSQRHEVLYSLLVGENWTPVTAILFSSDLPLVISSCLYGGWSRVKFGLVVVVALLSVVWFSAVGIVMVHVYRQLRQLSCCQSVCKRKSQQLVRLRITSLALPTMMVSESMLDDVDILSSTTNSLDFLSCQGFEAVSLFSPKSDDRVEVEMPLELEEYLGLSTCPIQTEKEFEPFFNNVCMDSWLPSGDVMPSWVTEELESDPMISLVDWELQAPPCSVYDTQSVEKLFADEVETDTPEFFCHQQFENFVSDDELPSNKWLTMNFSQSKWQVTDNFLSSNSFFDQQALAMADMVLESDDD
jgi:hypothetical protein